MLCERCGDHEAVWACHVGLHDTVLFTCRACALRTREPYTYPITTRQLRDAIVQRMAARHWPWTSNANSNSRREVGRQVRELVALVREAA